MDSDAQGNEPIFIVGMPRSGTTLLSSVLSAHPRIAMSPETTFLNEVMHRHPELDLSRRGDFEAFWQDYITTTRFPHLGISADAAKARILAKGRLDYRAVFTGVLEEYAAKMGKPRWGEKTPTHYHSIGLLLEWFPHARVIYIIRDPRAVAASTLAVPWGTRHVDHNAAAWRECAWIMQKWASDRRVYVVKYEAVAYEPEPELRKLCEFLGEQYVPGMVYNRSETTSPIVNREGWAQEYLRASLRQPVKNPKNIDKWRSRLSPYQIAVIEHVTRKEMIAEGYQPVTSGLDSVQHARWVVHRMLSFVRHVMRTLGYGLNTYGPLRLPWWLVRHCAHAAKAALRHGMRWD